MKLLKTVQKLVEESERDYHAACDRCADERTIKRLEKNYFDTLKIFQKLNTLKNDKDESLGTR